jgi:aerobic-type carbon monoxide dehydrogenase small subunit (CoxS/CutS family)
MAAADVAPADSIVSLVDNVAMVTREPLDRLQQIIAQSWYWIGGYCTPSDVTTTTTTIPTATNAAYKRAVMIEHAG